MKIPLILCLFLTFCSCSTTQEKTVLLAILARNKAHTLPKYLECIENLDYNKKAITVYINTNNNKDETESLLKNWVEKNRIHYKQIVFQSHEVKELSDDMTNPHDWNATRFSVLGKIRKQSMQKALEHKCDYYFVIDCDNFVSPTTLKTLVSKQVPIIAPLLRSIKGHENYSNFFCRIDGNGYWADEPFFFKILNREIRGTFDVPVVHCTYLIDSRFIPKLSYNDETNDYEFVIFSRSARNGGAEQYICNEEEFGYLFMPQVDNVVKVDLETEKRLFGNVEIVF